MNIIGRVTRDAEIRTTANDRKLVSFTVAENETYKRKDGERVQNTTYFDCAYWISTNIAKILTKGTMVELSGRVEARAWSDGEGNTKTGLNVNANSIKVHGGGTRTTEAEQESQPATAKRRGRPAKQQDDDLPF